jgi:hypothetical protein
MPAQMNAPIKPEARLREVVGGSGVEPTNVP